MGVREWYADANKRRVEAAGYAAMALGFLLMAAGDVAAGSTWADKLWNLAFVVLCVVLAAVEWWEIGPLTHDWSPPIAVTIGVAGLLTGVVTIVATVAV